MFRLWQFLRSSYLFPGRRLYGRGVLTPGIEARGPTPCKWQAQNDVDNWGNHGCSRHGGGRVVTVQVAAVSAAAAAAVVVAAAAAAAAEVVLVVVVVVVVRVTRIFDDPSV